MLKKAVEAGGTSFSEPADKEGWMYGCGFADLDNHRWNVLYMNMSKMPSAQEILCWNAIIERDELLNNVLAMIRESCSTRI